MKAYRILAVNPGSTSTKVALFENEAQLFSETVRTTNEEMRSVTNVMDEEPARMRAILRVLEEKGMALDSLDAVVGRGGYMKRLTCGVYEACEEMIRDLREAEKQHVSSLGVILAAAIAKQAGIPVYTVNPVVVDEALPIAWVSGLKGIVRDTDLHCLSHKEIGRRMAQGLGKRYEACNFIIQHIGGGNSTASHRQGVVIDATAAIRGEGPFTGSRAGGVHPGQLVDLCFSGTYTRQEINDILMKTGGLVSYLGTDDGLEVERRIAAGDEYARLIYEALAYQHAREIGSHAAVMKGKVDAIGITGGLARSEMLMDWIRDRVEWIAPVYVYPGECEMEAMCMGVLPVLRGQARCKDYLEETRRRREIRAKYDL